jgi:large subunit ribosomal protein L21
MVAIVKVGSTQYVVNEKDEILVDRLDLEEGKNFMIDQVLLYASDDEKQVEIGTPYLDNVKVETRVMGAEKGEKIRVFKMKPKKRYERTQGHRSHYTRLKVLKVSVLSKAKKAA